MAQETSTRALVAQNNNLCGATSRLRRGSFTLVCWRWEGGGGSLAGQMIADASTCAAQEDVPQLFSVQSFHFKEPSSCLLIFGHAVLADSIVVASAHIQGGRAEGPQLVCERHHSVHLRNMDAESYTGRQG